MERNRMKRPALALLFAVGVLPVVSCVAADDGETEAADEQSAGLSVDNQTLKITALTSGKCVDVPGGSRDNGAQIQQWDCNGATAQAFTFRPAGGGAYQIVNQSSGKCLDIAGGSTATGAAILQWDCHTGDNQKFKLAAVPGSSTDVTLVAMHSGKCVDVPNGVSTAGAKLRQWDCNGAKAQMFRPEAGGSTGGGSTGGGSTGGGYDYYQACVDKVNALRASINLPPLVRRRDKEGCTNTEANEDFNSGQAHGPGVDCGVSAGQCECPSWGKSTDKQIVDGCLQMMWDEGPGPWEGHGHYQIMTGQFNAKGVACGIYRQGDNVYAVQNYFQ